MIEDDGDEDFRCQNDDDEIVDGEDDYDGNEGDDEDDDGLIC